MQLELEIPMNIDNITISREASVIAEKHCGTTCVLEIAQDVKYRDKIEADGLGKKSNDIMKSLYLDCYFRYVVTQKREENGDGTDALLVAVYWPDSTQVLTKSEFNRILVNKIMT